MQQLNLNWLKTFEAVARLSGFTAASKELGLTQTAVSLHIKGLEAKLGQQLFLRRPKSVQLTEIGKAYLPSVQNALKALELSTNGLFGPNLKSTIVVRASMAAIMWLAPRLRQFHDSHPDIGIKLVTAIWADTSETQNVDVDIILATDTHATSGLELLSEEFIVPISGTETAKKIHTVEDLAEVMPVHILGFDDHWSRYMAAAGLQHDVKATRMIVDTSVAACELVASNMGCAMVIERFAQSAINSGQRIQIVGKPVPLGQSHYLNLTQPSNEILPATHAFRDWLHEQFSAATYA